MTSTRALRTTIALLMLFVAACSRPHQAMDSGDLALVASPAREGQRLVALAASTNSGGQSNAGSPANSGAASTTGGVTD